MTKNTPTPKKSITKVLSFYLDGNSHVSNQMKSSSPKDALFRVWLKLIYWF